MKKYSPFNPLCHPHNVINLSPMRAFLEFFMSGRPEAVRLAFLLLVILFFVAGCINYAEQHSY